MRFNVKALALTCGIFWGLGLFILTWWVIFFGDANGQRTIIGLVYRGYNLSPVGSIYGLVWGFVDGAICGAFFGWLHNKLTSRTSN